MRKAMVVVVASVFLALVGGLGLAAPAAATPPATTTKTAQTQQAKAAAAAVRAQHARAVALTKLLATSWPRYRAALAAANQARREAGTTATQAARHQLIALNAARAATAAAGRSAQAKRIAAAAKATSNRVASTKASWKTKAAARKKAARAAQTLTVARSAAKKATKAAARAAARSATVTRAANRAATRATSTAASARKAWLQHVALAAPRAAAAARQATATKHRAATAKRAAAQARARSATVQRSATVLLSRSRVAATRARSAATVYARINASKTATAAVKRAAKARAAALGKVSANAAARYVRAAKIAARYRSAAATAKATANRLATVARSARTTAMRTKIAAGPNPTWRPSDRVVFNNPKGSRSQQLAIIREINAAIDATPAGGEIRMAQYLFNINSVATKLIAADRRGASVQILVDDGELRKPLRRVRKALGTNTRARSFVATCHHSCMSNGASTIHAKFYLFSVAGRARYVSMISSANPYTGNTFNSWNNSHTIVGNQRIYDSLNQYFTDMLADRNNPNYFRVTSSGKYTIYLYPQAIRRPNEVVLLNVLNRVSCATTAKGYGAGGRTLIRVANWGWTSSRMDIARRLWQLHDSGCRVQVMINKGRISRPVVKQLLKPSKKFGKMPVYDAWYDGNLNDAAGLYLHHKMIAINGLLDHRNVKITWTGSQNFTRLAASANNDIILRVVDPRVTDAYVANFAYIRQHYTHRMLTVPLTTGRLKPSD